MARRKSYTISEIRPIPVDKVLEVSLLESKSEMMLTRRIHESEINFTLFKSLHKGEEISCIVDSKIRAVERIYRK